MKGGEVMITKIFDGKTLILVLENGVNAFGKPVFAKKSIKYINELASEDQIHEVGLKLAELYDNALANISIDEDYVLVV